MAQKALFFMDDMRCTQTTLVGSHLGSLASDWGGADTGKDALYAPFDCVVARVRDTASHETYLHSVAPVLCADGVTRDLTLVIMHDDVVDVAVGQTILRGDKIGDEGTFYGGKTGGVAAHVHVEVATGHQSSQSANSYGTYVTANQIAIESALFLPSDVNVLYDGGFAWVKTDEKLHGDTEVEALDASYETEKSWAVTVLVSGLRLRTLPKADAEAVQIDSLAKGAIYPLTQTKDGWAFLEIAEGVGGWACISEGSATYLQICEV